MNQEIVKKTKREYVCGNLHCGKKYGTNAALYTHIKNKHQGITPHGTIRPPLESIKGRKGRPTSTKIDSQQQDDTINERINIVKIMSNPQFQEFIYLIGSIGDNNIIRDQDEQYEYITINELNNIQMDCVIIIFKFSLENVINQKNNIQIIQYNHHLFGNQNYFMICIIISYMHWEMDHFRMKEKVRGSEKLQFLQRLLDKNNNKMQMIFLKLSELQ